MIQYDNYYQNCYWQVKTITKKNSNKGHKVMYTAIWTRRCTRTCIHTEKSEHEKNKDVLQTETKKIRANTSADDGRNHSIFLLGRHKLLDFGINAKLKIKWRHVLEACHLQLPFLSLLHLPPLWISGLNTQFCFQEAFLPHQNVLFSLKWRPWEGSILRATTKMCV